MVEVLDNLQDFMIIRQANVYTIALHKLLLQSCHIYILCPNIYYFGKVGEIYLSSEQTSFSSSSSTDQNLWPKHVCYCRKFGQKLKACLEEIKCKAGQHWWGLYGQNFKWVFCACLSLHTYNKPLTWLHSNGRSHIQFKWGLN